MFTRPYLRGRLRPTRIQNNGVGDNRYTAAILLGRRILESRCFGLRYAVVRGIL